MFRKPDVSSKSQFPISGPTNETVSYEEFLKELETLFDGEDPQAFFEAIEKAPPRWQRKPELMLSKAVGLLRIGDESGAQKVMAEIERTHPKFAPLYYYRATLSMQEMSPAHALRAINKVRTLGVLDDDAESQMSEMEKVARHMLKESATELGVSLEQMEKASWHHEAAQEKLGLGQWQAAEQGAREATRLIPRWTAPRNNRSYVLYFLGRIDDALAEANAVLAQEPDNLHALKNMVIFLVGLGEDEKAREYSRKMALHLESLPPDAIEVDTIISTLGLVDDDQTLWSVAQKYLRRDYEDLMDLSWYALGVAAIRAGRLKEARKLLEKAELEYEPAQVLVVEVRKALKEGRQMRSMPVYSVIGTLLSENIVSELIEMLSHHTGDDQLPRYLQKKLEEYVQKRPFIVNGLMRMLLEPASADAIPRLLLMFNRPEIDARLLAFALGDAGTSQQRLNVLSAMAQMGREVPPSPIRFWNEEKGEWTEADFSAQMLSDDIELNISPKAAEWAQKAQEAKTDDESIKFWRKAVETDPKSGYAVHMLGILLIRNGQAEEGKRLARRAIEVDPDYMFACANLALMEAQQADPNTELAMQYVNKVAKAPVITVQTAFIMHVALMFLAVEQKDFEAARKEYEIAFELRPDDPILEGWDARLRIAEVFAGGWLAEWQAKSRERTHNKAMRTNLEPDSDAGVTLNSLTRDVLGVVARYWGLTSYGRKAELIQKIRERMREPETVEYILGELTDREKEALRHVLNAGGSVPWKQFTDQYGNDAEESPYWNYHEPETIIGRLGRAGLLAKGTLNETQVVFMPVDVRSSLQSLLS